jgi:type I restriction enzyme M protein
VQDIAAHLQGGIPQRDIDDLARFWRVFPTLEHDLFEDNARPGYSELRIPTAKIKDTILAHPEFATYTEAVTVIFAQWRDAHRPRLMALTTEDRPRDLIETLSEALLRAFAPARLIDRYDVYQHLMAYWTETMQDDVYMIVEDGWLAANRLRLLEAKSKEPADLKIARRKYKADLIPPALIIARYFAAEQEAIEALEAEEDAIAQQIAELEEEHGGEEGLLEEAKSDAGNVTKTAARARLREIEGDPDFADEFEMVEAYLAMCDQESAVKKQIKAAQEALDAKVLGKYQTLTEAESKTLVVDDKWLAALAAAVQGELDRVSQALTDRVRELAERYATPLPDIVEEVDDLSAKVDAHLERMGFAWK